MFWPATAHAVTRGNPDMFSVGENNYKANNCLMQKQLRAKRNF